MFNGNGNAEISVPDKSSQSFRDIKMYFLQIKPDSRSDVESLQAFLGIA